MMAKVTKDHNPPSTSEVPSRREAVGSESHSPKGRVGPSTTLKEVLESKGAEKILAKYNLPCLTCPMAQFEMQKLTLRQVCEMYGIDVDKLLKELNKGCKKKRE